MIFYVKGAYDVLRESDLQKLDFFIQRSREKAIDSAKYDGKFGFGVGIYSSDVCQELGQSEPIKSLADRLKIMEQIRGVDFVFPIESLDEKEINKSALEAYNRMLAEREKNKDKPKLDKMYDLGYAPGTYDLFHAGHLENLMIAASACKRLIVGVKGDELVKEHKKRDAVICCRERMEILRHFKFVYDTYSYYTRDLYSAKDWIKSKHNQDVDAIFLGEDLIEDFKKYQEDSNINLVFTPRPAEKQKSVSTTALRTIYLGRIPPGTVFTEKRPDTDLAIIDDKKIDPDGQEIK